MSPLSLTRSRTFYQPISNFVRLLEPWLQLEFCFKRICTHFTEPTEVLRASVLTPSCPLPWLVSANQG